MGGIFEKLWQIATKHPRESLKIQANLSKTAYANQRGGGRAKRTKFELFGRFVHIFAGFGCLFGFSGVFGRFQTFLNVFGPWNTYPGANDKLGANDKDTGIIIIR